MEVFDELMESEVSIVVPHITEIVRFCLEVGFKNLHFAHICLLIFAAEVIFIQPFFMYRVKVWHNTMYKK